MKTTLSLLAALALPLAPALPAHAAGPALPRFDAAQFAHPAPNPYFPMVPGTISTFKGTATDANGTAIPFTRVRTIVGPGPTVLGVATTAIRDDESEGTKITESSTDYYATDASGAVWYFGEDVLAFAYDAKGNLTQQGPGPSWRAGVDKAQPGVILEAAPVLAKTMYRAHAVKAGEMEYSTPEALALTLNVPGGSFGNVVKVYTASAADPELREYSYWAKGKGLVRTEEDLSAAKTDPKIVSVLQP